MIQKKKLAVIISALGLAGAAHGAPTLLAIGSLPGTTDKSGLTGTLESGLPANVLGGTGSAIAWAGGNTFLTLPDRGPNANAYAGGAPIDNTTSYIPRFNTITMNLTAGGGGSLPYSLTPTLQSTTLLWSSTPLAYGNTAGVPAGNQVNASAASGQYYFSGRSDNFVPGSTANPNDARLDPEGMRVSKDGSSVFISDEYGPYVYQFNRATGERTRTFTLPANLAAPTSMALGASEISGNPTGRVTNKGMEGLAITPDGKSLIGFMQSPLAQDGGDGGRYNRIVTIDIATGTVKQFAYDNKIGSKNYNSSEIVAINDHEFLVLERDGKGLGDGSPAVIKKLMKFDITGAEDVSNLSGAAALAAKAIVPTEFFDIKLALNAFGIADTDVPSKIEGIAFGEDVDVNGELLHTMWITNDNDFLPGVAGPNNFYVFGFKNSDLNLQQQQISEPASIAMLMGALGMLGVMRRKKSA